MISDKTYCEKRGDKYERKCNGNDTPTCTTQD